MTGQIAVSGGIDVARSARRAGTMPVVGRIKRLLRVIEWIPAPRRPGSGVERPSFTLCMDNVRPYDTRPFW
jgi:hypothetical protein